MKFQTSQPALTELENLGLDRFAELFSLPEQFSFEKSEKKVSNGIIRHVGGGSIQNSGTDAIFNTMVAARFRALRSEGAFGTAQRIQYEAQYFNGFDGIDKIKHPADFIHKFCCIASYEAHSSVRKAAKLALLDCLQTAYDNHVLTYNTIKTLYDNARDSKQTPIYALLSLGTPNGRASDSIKECAEFCNTKKIWCHVNASYAGNALILSIEKTKELRNGLELVDSINISPYKMLSCAPDLALLYVKDTEAYTAPFKLDAEYLLNKHAGTKDEDVKANSIEYRNYGVPLTRRWRALKIMFVLEGYGLQYLTDLVENIFKMAKHLKEKIASVKYLDLSTKDESSMGIIVFRNQE